MECVVGAEAFHGAQASLTVVRAAVEVLIQKRQAREANLAPVRPGAA